MSPGPAPLFDVHEVAGEGRERGGSHPSQRPSASGAEQGAGRGTDPGDRPSSSQKGSDGGDGGSVSTVERANLAPGGPAASEGSPPKASAEEKGGNDAHPVVGAGGGVGDG